MFGRSRGVISITDSEMLDQKAFTFSSRCYASTGGSASMRLMHYSMTTSKSSRCLQGPKRYHDTKTAMSLTHDAEASRITSVHCLQRQPEERLVWDQTNGVTDRPMVLIRMATTTEGVAIMVAIEDRLEQPIPSRAMTIEGRRLCPWVADSQHIEIGIVGNGSYLRQTDILCHHDHPLTFHLGRPLVSPTVGAYQTGRHLRH